MLFISEVEVMEALDCQGCGRLVKHGQRLCDKCLTFEISIDFEALRTYCGEVRDLVARGSIDSIAEALRNQARAGGSQAVGTWIAKGLLAHADRNRLNVADLVVNIANGGC